MAFTARKVPDEILFALVAQHNKNRVDSVASAVHYDVSSITTNTDYTAPSVAADTIATANATDLTTSIALTNSTKKVINRHYADVMVQPLTGGPHKAATTAIATVDGTDLTTSITLANAVKASYNTHIGSTTFHANADGTNTVAAANATDQTTLNTLVNGIKTAFNAHVILANGGQAMKIVDA